MLARGGTRGLWCGTLGRLCGDESAMRVRNDDVCNDEEIDTKSAFKPNTLTKPPPLSPHLLLLALKPPLLIHTTLQLPATSQPRPSLLHSRYIPCDPTNHHRVREPTSKSDDPPHHTKVITQHQHTQHTNKHIKARLNHSITQARERRRKKRWIMCPI